MIRNMGGCRARGAGDGGTWPPRRMTMTEQKKLKAHVRDRMARTGESYTTAHRNVAHISGVVPGYPGFGSFEHRPSTLARRLLAQVGVDVDEPMACGLGGGVGFLYSIFEYKAADHPLLTIVAQHHPMPWLEAVTTHLGIVHDVQHSSGAKVALRKLDDALTHGRAAQLQVARDHLPWHTGVDPMEAAEPYAVVVAGVDGGDYLVDDVPGGPWRIGAEDLGAAWAAHRKGRFEITTLAPPTGRVDVPQAVRGALTLTADHLTGPVLGHAFDVNFGLSGMAKLSAELREPRRKSGWRARFGEPAAFGYAMSRLAECLTTAYTAPAGTRPLYARFLAEAAALLEDQRLKEAAAAFAASGDRWQAVVDLAGAAAGAEAGAAALAATFDAIADHVDAAAAHESEGVSAIRAALT
ncbi:DUF4872 domain-containing protein [Georgenia yuyongxinii]|uniref:DUF4872 domain-containing protein n=2 Tax=Georgenia yuyongxinii TaxID=2589797 RepID=A0A5B8C7Z9_9MICO|nr:DUF4872 domain-containing protein [Georgenia yuyongxinii]